MMIRNVSRGKSFTKLAAYLTQPRDSQHRALWSSVENGGTDDPRLAAKIMAHTSIYADDIKARAGIGKGGRKADDCPVYHVVMSWLPDQKPDPAHQLETAREMLAAIGLDKAQAVIVAHNDNGLEHLHIMVNLVDPATGRRFSLSYDHDKMEAFGTAYMERHGTLEAMPKRAAKVAAKAEGKAPPDRAERISRPAMNAIDRAARADYKKLRADREAAFSRQAAQRGELRSAHSAEWTIAKREAAMHRTAYKAAFRAAYERAKAEDRAANKPKWGQLFRAQEAERARIVRAVDRVRAQADRARIEARQATAATVTAERRSRTVLGALAQRVGIAATPERAASRQLAAAEAMRQAAHELAAIELAKAGLKAKQDAERGALAKALGEVTFAKAQLATDALPRVDFAELIKRQDAERAAMIEQQNAERDTLGMKPYEPKPSRKDDPMTRPLAAQDSARRAFAEKAPPATPERGDGLAVKGVTRAYVPRFKRGDGGDIGAPIIPAKEQDQGRHPAEPKRTPAQAFDNARQFNPLAEAEAKNNTPEAKAARQAENKRNRARDDFDNER